MADDASTTTTTDAGGDGAVPATTATATATATPTATATATATATTVTEATTPSPSPPTTTTTPTTPTPPKRSISMVAKWGGREYSVQVDPEHDTLGDLKARLAQATYVLPKRQKLMGLTRRRVPLDDTTPLAALELRADQRFMLVGTPEDDIRVDDLALADMPDVLNDFDVAPTADAAGAVATNADNLRRLEQRKRKARITYINPPRDGKKLAVLDLDYTLFDCKSTANSIPELARPFLHEFLEATYEHFDICIWSQTSWRWLEVKITELGMLTHARYKISFVMDATTMFTVNSTRNGVARAHEVKALEVIWHNAPQWNAKNTVHVDDLGRNFALNPQNGLRCVQFKNAPITRATDQELFFLAKYMSRIGRLDDLSSLDHNKWREYLERDEDG